MTQVGKRNLASPSGHAPRLPHGASEALNRRTGAPSVRRRSADSGSGYDSELAPRTAGHGCRAGSSRRLGAKYASG